MSNDNCVTKLIQKTDRGVHFTVFDDTESNIGPEEVYENWLQSIKISLGNCVFRNEFCALSMFNSKGEGIIPMGIRSTEDAMEIVRNCFDSPQTFRMDITTPYDTTFSWLFILASDLSNN
ncbi:MAG: hypothetical protein IJ272_09990 [Clostridia bacterium]|nr:hypothetical protein [Clostridia bacterium]